MAQVSFNTGTKANVDKAPKKEGSLYFTTDTNEIIFDVPGGSRASFGGGNIEIPDFEEVTTAEVDAMISKYFS